MSAQSSLLARIEQALRDKGVDSDLRSVGDLRSFLPGYLRPSDLRRVAELGKMLRDIEASDRTAIDVWMAQPKQRARGSGQQRSGLTKSSLSADAIRALSLGGFSLGEIAKIATISKSRVNKILRRFDNAKRKD